MFCMIVLVYRNLRESDSHVAFIYMQRRQFVPGSVAAPRAHGAVSHDPSSGTNFTAGCWAVICLVAVLFIILRAVVVKLMGG